jgi:hypothetical protein
MDEVERSLGGRTLGGELDEREVGEETGYERGDEGGRGAETSLVCLCNGTR